MRQNVLYRRITEKVTDAAYLPKTFT